LVFSIETMTFSIEIMVVSIEILSFFMVLAALLSRFALLFRERSSRFAGIPMG
jgi:hypothetical protein